MEGSDSGRVSVLQPRGAGWTSAIDRQPEHEFGLAHCHRASDLGPAELGDGTSDPVGIQGERMGSGRSCRGGRPRRAGAIRGLPHRPRPTRPDGPQQGSHAAWRTITLALCRVVVTLPAAIGPKGITSYAAGAGARRGKNMAKALRRTVRTCSGGISALGSSGSPSSLMLFCSAYPRSPSSRVFPSWDTTCPRAVKSSWNSGTGRATGTGHVFGSRGVSRVKAWENVRAAASRPVNGSPRFHCSRRVAISEV